MSQDPTRHFYETYAEEYERQTKDLKSVEFLNRFIALLPASARVLDLGCAYGRDSAVFVESGLKVIGVDYSDALIQRARELVPGAEFQVGDFRDLSLPPGSFDGVWAYMCFLHLQKSEVVGLLQWVKSCLAPEGILGVGMKIGEGEGFVEDTRYGGALKYFSQYGEDEFRKLLQAAGFRIKDVVVRPRVLPYQDKPVLEILAQKA